jgi:hypothetical protein
MNIFTSITDPAIRANIRDSHGRADAQCRADGADWYPSTNRLVNALADAANLDPAVVAGMVAVLSPRSAWHTNVKNTAAVLVEAGHLTLDRAVAILYAHGYGRDPVIDTLGIGNGPRGLGASIAKARTLADGGSVNYGQKTLSFLHNILDPAHSDDVTVDAWAAGVALGRRLTTAEMSGLTVKQYARMVEQYRIVAAELGIVPSELQAITWCELRGRAR